MSIETIVDGLVDRFNRTAEDLAAVLKNCPVRIEDAVHGYFVRRWIANWLRVIKRALVGRTI